MRNLGLLRPHRLLSTGTSPLSSRLPLVRGLVVAIEAPSPLVHWRLSFHLPLVHGLVVAIEAPLPLVLSTRTSPPVCLSFAGWLSHCLVPPPCVTCHLSSRSRRMHPSSTPPLCSHQLVVVSHLASLRTTSASRRAAAS